MTAPTATPPSVEELMPQAVELARRTGQVPSRDRLMKTFRIGRPKASQIYRQLQMESAKLRSRRARRVAELQQKAPVRRTREVRLFDPSDVPVSPGVGPADPWSFAVPAPTAGGVRTSTEGPLPDTGSAALPAQVKPKRRAATWPVGLLALPAFVAIWSGWVDLGRLTGFGVVHPLPGIADEVALNTAITLPVGLETYAAYALYVWLSGNVPAVAARFARWSAIGSLVLGAGGQVTYHLLVAAGVQRAPWWITTIVACFPVAVLGMGAALRHLVHAGEVNE
jgi:hypothetical protein